VVISEYLVENEIDVRVRDVEDSSVKPRAVSIVLEYARNVLAEYRNN
jgi:hypothetical protein